MVDVVIIGAGPAGIFCAHQLAGKKNIVVIDQGHAFEDKICPYMESRECLHCSPCSTLMGFGGAAFYHPGKLSLYPAGTGIKTVVGDEKACLNYYTKAIELFHLFGIDGLEYKNVNIPIQREGFRIKYYNSCPINKEVLNAFAMNMQEWLSKHVPLLFNTRAERIEKGRNWKILLSTGEWLETHNVVVGTGEAGYRWWDQMAHRLELEQIPSGLDIGVRLEFSSKIIERVWSFHKDLKVFLEAPDGSEIRTYCVLKNGRVIPCYDGMYSVLDGIAEDTSSVAGMTVFNRIQESVIGNKVQFAMDYLEKYYGAYDSPQSCSIEEFIADKNFLLPNFIYENLKWGIKELCAFLGIESGIVYTPIIDNLWKKTKVDRCFMTDHNGLFVVGDASGVARGILQACVSGIIAADGIEMRG